MVIIQMYLSLLQIISGHFNNSQVGIRTGRYPIMWHSINGVA